MPADKLEQMLAAFSDPEHVAGYTEGPKRFVPGFEALHQMMTLLLAERMPRDGRVLVLGAGGGLEMDAMAQAQPGWRFVGVDPAGEMLRLAAKVLGTNSSRAELIEGYIDDAPEGLFDSGTCLLTLHFLEADERERTLREVRRRLKPGAPFVAAHGSFPQADPVEKALWLSRYAAYAVACGADPAQAEEMQKVVAANVHMLSPEQDAEILRAAGFTDVSSFYAAFTWRGWIATA